MSSQTENTRVRFAPSPTGYLHVGGARTAIFNWLFARKHGGTFLLRIEDTDVERSGPEMVDAILHSMKWLGLEWDEEVVYQSARLDLYHKHIDELILNSSAYKCFCSKKTLEERRALARLEKREYKYKQDRTCLNLSSNQVESFVKEGRPCVVRLKLSDGQTVFRDEIYGEIKVAHSQLDDFIIQRSDGTPTYHFAVVVDDHEMGITHILRGDDHLSNTPKHVLLYQAFGWPLPVFAHVPMILGPDKKRLSKRHGATSVGEYERAGYLPEAMLNFLTLLGWSSGDDRELFNRDELIEHFELNGISKKSAVFDEKKLEWMNGQYIMQLDDKVLQRLVMAELISAGLVTEKYVAANKLLLDKILALLKPRVKRLSDVVSMSRYFFQDPQEYEEKGVRKHWKDPQLMVKFEELSGRLADLDIFTAAGIEPVMRGLAEEHGLSAAKLIHPTRLALTGVSFSPGMFEVMELLGKETVLRRLHTAMDYLRKHPVEEQRPGA
ncbi:MAG: glutamate--tRNA ligase [bacterium]